MERSSAFLSNRRRIRRVLDHMINRSAAGFRGEADERVCLDQLASIACWSGEHLVRAWHRVFGQPPLATARRIQLDFAASALRRGEPVAHVAVNAGYGSGQAFAHAFQRQFGMSASTYQRSQLCERRAPMRIVHIEEPVTCLAVPYSGIARQSMHTFDSMFERLVKAGSHRSEWDVFSIRRGGDHTVELDDDVDIHASVVAKFIRIPIRGLDGFQIPAGAYAVFDQPFCLLGSDPDLVLDRHGWQRRDAPRLHQFITDPARTIPSLRRDRRWIPVAPTR